MRAEADFPIPEPEFREIYRRVPRLTVELVLSDATGLVLARRDIEPCKGQWHLPGGTVQFGESLTDAVRRIGRRELGVTVAPVRLLGYVEYPLMHASGYFGWPVGLAFETTLIAGQLRGNAEGTLLGRFTSVPDNTIAEQARFISEHVFGRPPHSVGSGSRA